METKPKIALVDDHALFRKGLKGLLEMSGRCEVVAQSIGGMEFIDLLRNGLDVDVLLLDIDMPVMDGFQVAQKLAQEWSEIKIITLSMHGDEDYYFRMLSLGVKGFLLKNSDVEEVLTAITAVARGGTYFSQELLTSIVDNLHATATHISSETLSERELEILLFICKGLSNQQIAERLFISKRTVDKHRANILDKTVTKNTAELVIYAIRNALVEI